MPNATPFGMAADPKKLAAFRKMMAKKMGSHYSKDAEKARIKREFPKKQSN